MKKIRLTKFAGPAAVSMVLNISPLTRQSHNPHIEINTEISSEIYPSELS